MAVNWKKLENQENFIHSNKTAYSDLDVFCYVYLRAQLNRKFV